MYRLYDCPKCGKKESSFDGYTFCGSCEEKFHREEEEFRRLQEEKEYKLSRRAWIHETGEQVSLLTDCLYDPKYKWKVKVKYRNGSTGWIKDFDAEPAEIPGGGLILYTKKGN